MASELFKNFPEISYPYDDKIVKVKDFFRKAKIDPSVLDQYIEYTYYECQEGDRPDVVASKLYGNADLHWTLFLVNDVSNYYDWFKGLSEFENFISSTYRGTQLEAANTFDIVGEDSKILMGEIAETTTGSGSVVCVDATTSRIVVDNVSGTYTVGQTVTGRLSTHSFQITNVREHRDGCAYFTNGSVRSNVRQSGWTEVSFYQDELNKNEERRFIKFIKPSKIKLVVSEFEKVIKS